MKHKKTFRMLSQSPNGYIGVCECCNEFNFSYKTVLLTFQEEDMLRFFNWIISNANSPQHFGQLPNGRTRIFSSPNSNLFLTFFEEEIEEIRHLYQESSILLEAQKILLTNRMS